MSKERQGKKHRGPKDISSEERAVRDFIRALKCVYKPRCSKQTDKNICCGHVYSPASPTKIFEAIKRARSPQKNSD